MPARRDTTRTKSHPEPYRDGVAEENVWKDTVLAKTGETVDILVDVTNPGRWFPALSRGSSHPEFRTRDQRGIGEKPAEAGGRLGQNRQQNLPICRRLSTGATGLEPATSGVTGRSWQFRVRRG
jgi:hypothetical protein